MTAADFNAGLAGLINSVFQLGVAQGRCDASQIVGILEIQKAQIIRQVLEANALASQKILAAKTIPRFNPNGGDPK